MEKTCTEPLNKEFCLFSSIFEPLSIRIIFSIVTSFLLSMIIAPRVIFNLKSRQIGQNVREEGIKEHLKKSGIPTMGGIIILIPLMITTILWCKLNPFVVIALLVTAIMGLIGFFDDITKVVKARSLGLTARQKLFGQILAGFGAALAIKYYPGLRFEMTMPGKEILELAPTCTQLPVFGAIDLGWLYIPFAIAVIVGATNAVNLTDGLDGLAAGTVVVAATPFMVFAYVCGHIIFARHIGVVYIAGVGELAVMSAAIGGGCLGFLWHNAHPASVFMGDTGSLALGGALGAIALCSKTEFYLAIVGGIFVIEALSVIMQVSYFKMTKGKRIFKMSPIHHHFELCGWAEEKVVIRFWMAGIMMALVGLTLFASRLVATAA
ncbi:MAG: phospho-N-acetylmuramoyl-pentapeptide-transferase [Candidatus Riflebacteria bacterium HGW-Riflebacteria-2]|nr:MAG: phospho-N-acetylmuramoyl-pentapeptide-transferase [Candidatus Riflebacteria bacterium HGW-Riflebacteria-2]